MQKSLSSGVLHYNVRYCLERKCINDIYWELVNSRKSPKTEENGKI